jgi:hypothetical protein
MLGKIPSHLENETSNIILSRTETKRKQRTVEWNLEARTMTRHQHPKENTLSGEYKGQAHKTETHWVDQEVDRDLGTIESFHATSPDLKLQPIAIYMMHAGYERKYITAHKTPYNFFSMAKRRCIYSRGMPSYSE